MLHDLKFALRQLAKSPGFAVVAMLTLALGIGANTAIFSVVNAVLLEPLPYPQPDRLVQLGESPTPGAFIPFASGGAFVDWQDQSTQLESVAAAHSVDENMTGAGKPELLSGLEVSADYLRVFRVAPALGRDFLPAEDTAAGDHDVVIITDELWRTHFGADAGLVGKGIHLDGKRLTVVGILPPHALFANSASFLTPSVIRPSAHHMSRDYNYVVVVTGRLKPGATVAQAAEQLTVAKRGVRSLYPVFKQGWTVGAISVHEQVFGNLRPYLLTLLAAVGVVLLIRCANVANLLLARAVTCQSEMAIRVSLGATPWRIVRQLLVESLVLALVGGIVGLGLARTAIAPLVVFSGIGEVAAGAIGLNGRILGFTLLVSCFTGIAFGLVPALSAARPDVYAKLKEAARGSTSGAQRRIQGLLLISETALTVVLLVSAGLLLRSFVGAMSSDPGFKTDKVLVFDLAFSNAKAPSTAAKVRLGQQIIERLSRIPGVERVGMGSSVPMNGGNGLGDLISREERPETRNDFGAGFDSVGGDYFPALGIPLLSGRFLTPLDDSDAAPKVLLVNEALAHRFFGRENALGRLLHFKEATWAIVGVVGTVKRFTLDNDASPAIYLPRTYFPWKTCVVVRTKVPPLSVVPDIRRAIAEIDPDLPMANLRTLDQSVALTLETRKIVLCLLAVFAAAALVMACIGIYGAISYSVAQRRREMGIRMALGANRRDVTSLVLRQGLKFALVGLIVGLTASLGAGFLIANQLYQVSRTDPAVMIGVGLLLLFVALLASWWPARRASRVDPAVALRAD